MTDMEKFFESEQTEIIMDSKFWRETYKHMDGNWSRWLKANKGKGKLIVNNGYVVINHRDNAPGFWTYYGGALTEDLVYDKWGCYQEYRTKPYNVWDEPSYQYEHIEKAILITSIKKYAIPFTSCYDGKYVVEQPKEEISDINSGFIYFVRNGDIYKIGKTQNFERRLGELKPDEVLAIISSINYHNMEKKLHAHFKDTRIPQSEYFRLTRDQVKEVHKLMIEFNV